MNFTLLASFLVSSIAVFSARAMGPNYFEKLPPGVVLDHYNEISNFFPNYNKIQAEQGDELGPYFENYIDGDENDVDDFYPTTRRPQQVTTTMAMETTTTTTVGNEPTAAPSSTSSPLPNDAKMELDKWFRNQLNNRDTNLIDVLTRMLYYVSGGAGQLSEEQQHKLVDMLADFEPQLFDLLIGYEKNPNNKQQLRRGIERVKQHPRQQMRRLMVGNIMLTPQVM